MLGTRMCNNCWELDRQISAHPDIAKRMLMSMFPSWFSSRRNDFGTEYDPKTNECKDGWEK